MCAIPFLYIHSKFILKETQFSTPYQVEFEKDIII